MKKIYITPAIRIWRPDLPVMLQTMSTNDTAGSVMPQDEGETGDLLDAGSKILYDDFWED